MNGCFRPKADVQADVKSVMSWPMGNKLKK